MVNPVGSGHHGTIDMDGAASVEDSEVRLECQTGPLGMTRRGYEDAREPIANQNDRGTR